MMLTTTTATITTAAAATKGTFHRKTKGMLTKFVALATAAHAKIMAYGWLC